MEEMEKGRPKSIGRWLQKKALDLWPPLVEKVLRSDTLQGVLLDQLEKRIIRELWVLADPSKPQRVHKDQEAMVWAFMQSFRRALERHQLSRETFQGLLRSLLLLAIMRQPLFVLEVFGADHFRGEESLGYQIFYHFWRRTFTLPGSGEGNFGPGG